MRDIKYLGLVKIGDNWVAEFSTMGFWGEDVIRYNLPSITSAILNFEKFDKEIADELRKGRLDLEYKRQRVI